MRKLFCAVALAVCALSTWQARAAEGGGRYTYAYPSTLCYERPSETGINYGENYWQHSANGAVYKYGGYLINKSPDSIQVYCPIPFKQVEQIFGEGGYPRIDYEDGQIVIEVADNNNEVGSSNDFLCQSVSIGNYTGGRFEYSIQDMEFGGQHCCPKQRRSLLSRRAAAEFPVV